MRLASAARIILIGAPGVGELPHSLHLHTSDDVVGSQLLTKCSAKGKGTQSERLLKTCSQLTHVASGDLLRDNVRRQSAIGRQAQRLMSAGALVPDGMIIKLITNELTSKGWLLPKREDPHASRASTLPLSSMEEAMQRPVPGQFGTNENPDASFVLDGFPRTASQASQLDVLIPMNFVVHIDTPEEIILDRIANRWVHVPSGRVYNTTFNPPKVPGKDDFTGEPLTRREDDNPKTFKTRLRKFNETALPLLEHYDKKGLLWRVQGNSSDEISPKLFAEFGRRFGVIE